MLQLDTTTRAEYDAAITAGAKAQAVLDALGATVTVAVYDGSDTLMGSGLMQSPWATRSANVLTVGEVGSFAVTTNGTPDSNWYLRFEGNSRWLRGSFGLTGSGQDFTWSLGTWSTSQTGTLGTITATSATYPLERDLTGAYDVAAGAVVTFGWTVPEGYGITLPSTGGNYDLAQHLARPQGITPTYTLTTPITGVSVSASTGVLLVAPGTAAGVYSATVVADDNQTIIVNTGYRNTQTYLFQNAHVLTYPSTLGGNAYRTQTISGVQFADDTAGWGPTRDYVDQKAGWRWSNQQGDWINSAGSPQATTSPWATFQSNSASGAGASFRYTGINVASLLNHCFTNGFPVAVRVSCPAPRTFATTWNTTHAAPSISVQYADGSSGTLACRCVFNANSSSAYPLEADQTIAGPVFMEFERPTKAVSTATLALTITDHYSGDSTVSINLLRPAMTNPVQSGDTGLASQASALDVGLSSVPGIKGVHRYVDGSVRGDFFIDARSSTYNNELNYDPAIWGGTQDLNKWPHTVSGKWLVTSTSGNTALVASTYSGEGFSPLVAGMGAIKVVLPQEVTATGQEVGASATLGEDMKILFPDADFGRLQRLFVRYYLRLGTPMTRTQADRVEVRSGGTPAWTQMTGKMGIGPSHMTSYGGNSGNGGGGWGWQMRNGWYECDMQTGGPNESGVIVGFHVIDDYKTNNPVGYRYGTSADAGAWQYPMEKWGQQGPQGAVLYPGQWYCVETEMKLNTVNSVDNSWSADGELRAWVDGKLVFERTGMVFRTLPLYWNGINSPTLNELRSCRDLGIKELWLNLFHGGRTKSTVARTQFYTGLAWGTSRIGPMKLS